MKKYFVRGIIFASICLFYSTHSLSLVRERSYFSVISNHLTAAKFLGPMLIQEWISPIYRSFYSEKTQNQANNEYFQANLPCDREHIEMFVHLSIGRYLIKKMLKSDPVARKQIIQYIVSDFEKLIKSVGGRLLIEEIIILIEEIIKSDPSVREQIVPCIVNNFDRLTELRNGISLIRDIIENDQSVRQQITPCIIKNAARLTESRNGISLIRDIIKNDPDARQQITPCIIKNVARLIESWNGISLIDKIIKSDSDARQKIVLFLIEFPCRWPMIELFIKSGGLANIAIPSCIKKNNKEKNITKLPLMIFRYLCEKLPHNECLRSKLKEDSHEYSIKGIIKRIGYLKSCPEGENDRLKSSLPTVKHMERYRKTIVQWIDDIEAPIDYDDYFLYMLDRVFRKEVELEKSGYVAFKHAQRWRYGLPEKWFTTLWAITKEKPVTDFIFLHAKPLLKNDNLAGEAEMRERLLRGEWSSNNDKKYLLFMNYPLFGNVCNKGSSSIFFALKNDNDGKINISLKDVFDYLEYKDIYKKYEKQLQELEQEYQGLSKYGSMVVIGVPEDKLADSVCLTASDGWKVKVYIEGIGETDDIKTIITTLRHAPEKIKDSDRMEFALIMTQDKHGGLNPESGIKVHMFDAADPEKLAVFRKKEHLLLEQIKQEIEQEKSKKSAATANQFIRSAL